MPNSAVSLAAPAAPFKATSIDQATVTYFFTVTVGAGNYVAGGLPISFLGKVIANGNPIQISFYSYASPNSTYEYRYNPGATTSPPVAESQSSGSLQILSAGVEISGATPAGVVADKIRCTARFAR